MTVASPRLLTKGSVLFIAPQGSAFECVYLFRHTTTVMRTYVAIIVSMTARKYRRESNPHLRRFPHVLFPLSYYHFKAIPDHHWNDKGLVPDGVSCHGVAVRHKRTKIVSGEWMDCMGASRSQGLRPSNHSTLTTLKLFLPTHYTTPLHSLYQCYPQVAIWHLSGKMIE